MNYTENNTQDTGIYQETYFCILNVNILHLIKAKNHVNALYVLYNIRAIIQTQPCVFPDRWQHMHSPAKPKLFQFYN